MLPWSRAWLGGFRELLFPSPAPWFMRSPVCAGSLGSQEWPFCRASIHTGTHCSGKPSCLSSCRMLSPLISMRLCRMFRSRMTLLSRQSRVQPSLATLSFRMITPLSFKPPWQRMRNSRRSLSVRYPTGEKMENRSLLPIQTRENGALIWVSTAWLLQKVWKSWANQHHQ